MTSAPFTISLHDRAVDVEILNEVVTLYREIYAEPPYFENEEDVSTFASDLSRRAKQENFRLVVAWLDAKPLGFALGHQLPPSTQWWSGTLSPLSDDVKQEHEGRTFAIIELAVSKPYRRRGLGERLYRSLIGNLREERQTLLVRPEAEPAKSAYEKWGFSAVGQIRPFEGAPVYDVMLDHEKRN